MPLTTKFEFYRLYNTQQWRVVSRWFLQCNPHCKQCGQAAQVTDHIKPHNGDPQLFWDYANYQPLCRSCHNRKSAGERRPPGMLAVKRRRRTRAHQVLNQAAFKESFK